jgi:hypothetical protein
MIIRRNDWTDQLGLRQAEDALPALFRWPQLCYWLTVNGVARLLGWEVGRSVWALRLALSRGPAILGAGRSGTSGLPP